MSLIRLCENLENGGILTIRNELKFILRSIEFSICDTFKKILKSSFSFSKVVRSRDADACNLIIQYVGIFHAFHVIYYRNISRCQPRLQLKNKKVFTPLLAS